MRIKLPQSYSGEKIIKAFKKACNFKESEDTRWTSEMIVEKTVYELTTLRKLTHTAKVIAYPHFLRKKWFLFGEKIWVTEENPIFMIGPLVFDKKYLAFEINFREIYDCDMWGNDIYTEDIDFIQPTIEKILKRFYEYIKDSWRK